MQGIGPRPATAGDADAIAHVHRVARASYYGTAADPADGREEMWGDLLAQPDRITQVVEAEGRLVGFVSALRVSEPEALEMSGLYVLPAYAGAGIGSLLHDAFAGQLGRDEPGVLEVWAGNEPAIRFYRHRGWHPTTTTRPGPHGSDYVTYRLPARCRG